MPPPMHHNPVKISVASELGERFESELYEPSVEQSVHRRVGKVGGKCVRPDKTGRNAGNQARKIAEYADGAYRRNVAEQKERQHIREHERDGHIPEDIAEGNAQRTEHTPAPAEFAEIEYAVKIEKPDLRDARAVEIGQRI